MRIKVHFPLCCVEFQIFPFLRPVVLSSPEVILHSYSVRSEKPNQLKILLCSEKLCNCSCKWSADLPAYTKKVCDLPQFVISINEWGLLCWKSTGGQQTHYALLNGLLACCVCVCVCVWNCREKLVSHFSAKLFPLPSQRAAPVHLCEFSFLFALRQGLKSWHDQFNNCPSVKFV